MPEDKEKSQQLHNIRHSLAHVLAAAVVEMFPNAQLGVGPVIDTGFYYDFALPRPLTPEDLAKLEVRMRAIVKEGHDFTREDMSFADAKAYFVEKKQPFKVELIGDIEKHGTTVFKDITGAEAKGGEEKSDTEKPTTVSLYHTGKFTDLCRGGHVANTSEIDRQSFKLDRVSGAYWRGDQANPQMQRIYGLAFATKEDLEAHIALQAELEKRDHKKLGPALELFMFHHTSPGMPYWLPKGVTLYNELLAFWREEHKKTGYQEIASPLLNKKELYVTSGHFEHYWPDMFVANMGEGEEYGIKPMNCPNAMVVFGHKQRSYRELPLRLSDVDPIHRYELSGTLNGLLRVREFKQDDAHIFISEDMIEDEYRAVFEIVERFYSIFGLEYSFRLGTRPASFTGEIETWDKAEAALKKILDNHGKPYHIEEGDGAFYGPKVDILMKDALGREWQMGTVQLDFQQPKRFELEYIAADGTKKTPVAIHRVVYGSLERFIGILIEHFSGAFPVWLSPVQVKILPIGETHNAYAAQVAQELEAAVPGIRIETDDRSESIGKKIRDAETSKIPYMLVIGDKEMADGAVAVRSRGQKESTTLSVAEFSKKIHGEIKGRSSW
jgi:threonyl-tRNA synthetase